MLNFVKGLFRGRPGDPIAYQLPLTWFDQQLPGDLLGSGLHWIWESRRGGKAARAGVPERREATALTPELAASMTAELGEYEGDVGRAWIAFAFATPVEFDPARRDASIRAFAQSSAGPLLAIIYQEPEGPSEFFVGREPHAGLAELLEAWAVRLGKPVGSLESRPGGKILRSVFLDRR